MHLLILSHAYLGDLERLKEELSFRGFVDETHPEKARYGAVWREVKLYDVRLPEGCKEDFLGTISPFVPQDTYLHKHSPGLLSLKRWVQRLLRPFGLRSVDVPGHTLEHEYHRRIVRGRTLFVWLLPVGTIPELRDEDGKELL